MNKNKIIELLALKELIEIEELTYTDDVFVLRFYYDFDENEAKAARAYANDESEEDEEIFKAIRKEYKKLLYNKE